MAVTNTSPWYDYALQRVKDGPIPYERLVAEMMPLVPPGRAYRTAHTAAAHERERSGGSPEPRQYADAELDRMRRIRAGQRRLVVHSLNTTIKRGRLEDFTKDGVRMVKVGIANFDEVKARRVSSMSEYSKAFLRAVAGGAEVNLESLVPGLMVTVSRPDAIAKARLDRESKYERAKRPTKHGKFVKRKQPTDDEDYRIGARRIVMDPLSNLMLNQRIVSVGIGPERVISKGPRWYDPDAPTS